MDLPRDQQSLHPIQRCDGVDYVTQDRVTGILGGEKDHRREFVGALKEYEKR